VVSPATLTFTPSNWNTPQNVTVTGIDDEFDDGSVAYVVEFTAVTSTDALYAAVNLIDIGAANADNGDVAGVTITSDPNGLTTDEAGGTAVAEVVLSSQPTTDVEIDLSSSSPGEGIVAPATCAF